MKRYLILVLALVMTLSAFACTQKETAQNNDAQQTEPMPEAEATAEPEPEATAEPEPEATAEPEPMPAATEWPESIVDIWVLTKAEYSGITMNMANLGMKEGVIPVSNVLQAQTAWLSAHSTLVEAEIDVKLADLYLLRALGTLH